MAGIEEEAEEGGEERAAEQTGAIRTLAMASGFSRARFLAARGTATAFLVVALPYGNDDPDARLPRATEPSAEPACPARIAAFARRNYYAEAVARLKAVVAELRLRFGGSKGDYRILCNSSVPEKPLALAAGIGAAGRNSLIITPEAGSLVVLAALSLPFPVQADKPLGRSVCGSCTACVDACPTGALAPEDSFDRSRCIQWYASGNGEPSAEVVVRWGQRLYGCSVCQDVCPYNHRPIPGTATERGALPPAFDARDLVAASDEEIRKLFRGSAMGMAWLGAAAIRKNAERALAAALAPAALALPPAMAPAAAPAAAAPAAAAPAAPAAAPSATGGSPDHPSRYP